MTADRPAARLAAHLAGLTAAESRWLQHQIAERTAAARWAQWTPYPWQECPGTVAAQGMWLLMGGRGTGKTDGACRYVIEHVRGPACDPRIPGGHRIAIVAPTLGDAMESVVDGPSGLRAHDPRVRVRHGTGGTHVRFPGGAEAKLFGAFTAEDIERLRAGGNRCLCYLEEAAAMRHLGPALEHTAFGLRIGARPHYVASTTPKPKPELRELIAAGTTLLTQGRTAEAIHLDPRVRDKLMATYAGTRLGRQELDGELLDDVEGALWTYGLIDDHRLRDPTQMPQLVRIVVAIDPAATVTEHSDECGIVAVGADQHGELYVLADRSKKTAGSDAACRVWNLFVELAADEVVYESNQGGDWVRSALADTWQQMQRDGADGLYGAPPVAGVNAVRGKRLRAEPVATLYELGRVHHVGSHATLEDQMTTWVPNDGGDSPDRVDALVHAVARLASLGRPAEVATATRTTGAPRLPTMPGTPRLPRLGSMPTPRPR